jgi:RNA polymerase sigma-70 factor (ECF subfamily)
MSHNENFNERELQELQERIAAGDQRAFRRLFDLFAPRLIEFTYAMVKTKDAALEVADHVFISIWQNRRDVPQIKNLKVYLYTATKNAALNYISRKAREQVTEPFDFINVQLRDEINPEQQMITAEIFNKITAAINELPPRCKMIFKLVREDGLKYREVAEILNLSVNTVDAQMVIAVKRISERIKADFEISSRKNSLKKN